MSVVFALDARDADQAFSLGREIFASGSRASGLKPIRIVGLEITAVPDEEMAPETEAQAV